MLDYQSFVHPHDAYRGKPFWAWNGELHREELIRQIGVLKQMGFGGFFMHSRTGLETEYLGDHWFEMIRDCAAEAKTQGLEAWLYDEDRWPSGTAGGLVTENPEFRLKFLRLCVQKESDVTWTPDVVAAFVCRMDGTSFWDCHRIYPGERVTMAGDLRLLVFRIEEMEKEEFYNGYTYLNTLCEEATNAFLRTTHERYAAEVGDAFGGAIRGIFIDEPHRGALMDGFGLRNRDGGFLAPWTVDLFEQFEHRYGYALVDELPSLFLASEGCVVSQVKWHYVQLLQDLFLGRFIVPIHEWCQAHSILFTGHGLHEDSLSAQTAMTGSIMRLYEHMDYPGIDILGENNRSFWVAKQLSSVARQTGKKWMLSELYGATGWDMSFAGHKAVGDWQALFGINVRCHHLAWYTMRGESKRDYPASIFYQSAWWQDYDLVETYFARFGYLMSQGEPVCHLLVINPVESVWCQIGAEWSRGLTGQTDSVQRLERIYQDVFHWLSGAQLDFDYGEEDILSRLARVERDDSMQPVLRVGESVYTTVLVVGMTTIRSSTLSLLEEFIDLGGTVIFSGDPPSYVDALPSKKPGVVANGAVQIPLQETAVTSQCRLHANALVSAVDATTGLPIKDIFAQVRLNNDAWCLVFLNVHRDKGYARVRLQFPGQGAVEEWKLDTGQVVKRDCSLQAEGHATLVTDFAPGGEHAYIQWKNTDSQSTVRSSGQPLSDLPTEIRSRELLGPFSYSLSEPNVCVLDFPGWRFRTSEWQKPTEILHLDKSLRESVGLSPRGGAMIQPWYRARRDVKETSSKTFGTLQLRFRFDVDALPTGDLYLVLERPQDFCVSVNGNDLEASDFNGQWVDRCFASAHIPMSWIKMGSNEILLDAEFHEGIQLEALYLLGDFSVRTNDHLCTIGQLPETLEPSDITAQGFPFYSGVITYELGDTWLEDSSRSGIGSIGLQVPRFHGACIRFRRSDGSVLKTVGWGPFELCLSDPDNVPSSLDVVLTRRNTFGPLHLQPAVSSVYGPEHWMTEGSAFTRSYSLLSAGLLAPLKILIRKM